MMTTDEFDEEPETSANRYLREADTVLRENPVPAIITAVVIGFAIGLLARSLEPEPHPIRDCLEETSGYCRSLFRPFGKKARRAYAASSDAMHEAVEKMHDVDIEPIAKWWKRLWA